ncbi:glutathione hydrolase 1 proenzyme-like [Lingula anatina]|uniref:Glutathione hydrolase 1 proenzyme-like n=1 Tax=Lingula anatina TaxID=7574 RepID=A0A1S3JS09_LINAN|nr:glutathione hydrolase 1 proenzyme-like [Lingula anatina]|eukprot:XP_013413107.1 glutathione hydrolase 1 proenzyme-like [Lingula anatina]
MAAVTEITHGQPFFVTDDAVAGFQGDSSGRTNLVNEDDGPASHPSAMQGINSAVRSPVHTEISPLQRAAETLLDPSRPQSSPAKEGKGLKVIVGSSISFAVVITLALILQIYLGAPQVPPHGVVTSDNPVCSQIGVNIMQRGGTAVDAAIAAMFCLGVVHPHNSGLGGGGVMLVHSHMTMKSDVFNFLSSAPSAATGDMLNNNSTKGKFVAVPGELKGLRQAYDTYGSLPWADLVKPAADLARNGFKVSKDLAHVLNTHLSLNEDFDAEFKKTFTNSSSGVPYKEGDTMRLENLANTLDIIASQGEGALYGGSLGNDIIGKLQSYNGIITTEDLTQYSVSQEQPLEMAYGGYRVWSSAAPTAGPVLLYMLNILSQFEMTAKDFNTTLMYHRLAETFKFGYNKMSQLGDSNKETVEKVVQEMFNSSAANLTRYTIKDSGVLPSAADYGTANTLKVMTGGSHVSVFGPKEQMVSVTGCLGQWFGSKIMTSSGIILNAGMSAFSSQTDSKPNPNNVVAPNMRPLTGMAPAVFYSHDKPCSLRATFGGTNGTETVAGLVQALLNLVTFSQDIKTSIQLPRLCLDHYSSSVSQADIDVEGGFPASIQSELESKGHTIATWPEPLNFVQFASKFNEDFAASADQRNGGASAHF